LFKVGGLTSSESIPDRGTIAVNRQGTNTRPKTNAIGKFIREGIARNSQNRVNRSVSQGGNIIRIRRFGKLSNI
jgi:hypothetical protein